MYDGSGTPQTPEFLVNTFTPNDQLRPAVAADASGNFVIVWNSDLQDGEALGVFAQRFGPTGNRLGPELAVNMYTTGFQRNASVAFTTAGQFVITWASYGQDGSNYGLFAQRFNAAGSRIGAEFRVSSGLAGAQGYYSAVAAAAGGGFVVVWDEVRPGSSYDIVGQRFDGNGARVGSEFVANTFSIGTQFRPGVASDAGGAFVVAWDSVGQEGARAVVAQRFDALGARRGAEFGVGAATAGNQDYPGIGSDPVGNFTLAWTTRGVDDPANSTSAQAQRFGGLLPAALIVDGPGNGVLEPDETATMRPAWRNVNGASQTFAGGLVAITGPPGATYGIPDAIGNYGSTPSGTVRECTDCYVVSVSDAPVRPALHWDATATEAITPDVQGQRQPWALHIGKTFTDVPFAEPFYPSVETLVHHGITGGCGATTYCPSGTTTREQMAVMVLVAAEGPGYVPAPCTTPMFADVPAGNIYCRWVEELARRGVVSGCGGGNYCPIAPVAREQMAVFVLRALDPTSSPPACTTPLFADVPAASPYCRWIEELFRRGVVSGCGGGNYCPAAPVRRDEMGVFISGTFGLTLYGP